MAASDADMMDRDYGFYATMDEVLLIAIENIQAARHADSDMALEVNLKMASRAMRCALEMYGDRLASTVQKKEEQLK